MDIAAELVEKSIKPVDIAAKLVEKSIKPVDTAPKLVEKPTKLVDIPSTSIPIKLLYKRKNGQPQLSVK